jgi:hypothetical protein
MAYTLHGAHVYGSRPIKEAQYVLNEPHHAEGHVDPKRAKSEKVTDFGYPRAMCLYNKVVF